MKLLNNTACIVLVPFEGIKKIQVQKNQIAKILLIYTTITIRVSIDIRNRKVMPPPAFSMPNSRY